MLCRHSLDIATYHSLIFFCAFATVICDFWTFRRQYCFAITASRFPPLSKWCIYLPTMKLNTVGIKDISQHQPSSQPAAPVQGILRFHLYQGPEYLSG